jgi:hypothetical protein
VAKISHAPFNWLKKSIFIPRIIFCVCDKPDARFVGLELGLVGGEVGLVEDDEVRERDLPAMRENKKERKLAAI